MDRTAASGVEPMAELFVAEPGGLGGGKRAVGLRGRAHRQSPAMAGFGLQAGRLRVASQQLVQDLPRRQIVTWFHDFAFLTHGSLHEKRRFNSSPDSTDTARCQL